MAELFAAAIIVVAYVVPTIISISRKHPNNGSICVVNLLLGWTIIGWIIALAWAVSNIKR